ncbi:hypothetical protein ACFW04_011192 [Cataglyphis niger]
MTNRIHSALYQLKLCRQLLPETLKFKFVISLIYPHVDYCCAAYTDMTTEQNLRLHKAVNVCVRFIFNVRTDEYITSYYVKLRWLKVDARRAYFVGCLLYKILETKQPSLLHSNFNCKIATLDRATEPRAPRDMLFLPQCRTELYKQSFRLTSARFWNSLPQSIQSATTLADFKQKLYSQLLVCASS